ncbi:MAG: glycine cleavage system protein GcvH [Mycobacteriaceae bacterium]
MPDETVPDELRYTAEHEWIRESGEGVVRVGVTHYAQAALGDVVYVQLPDVGADAAPGAAFGEVESTKSVSDVFAPVPGTVSARNEALDDNPELVNSAPYGEGWLVEIKIAEGTTVQELLAGMLDAQGYRELTAGES